MNIYKVQFMSSNNSGTISANDKKNFPEWGTILALKKVQFPPLRRLFSKRYIFAFNEEYFYLQFVPKRRNILYIQVHVYL